MADYEAKRIDEMEAAFLGSFKRARAELGVESFGMQVIDLPPNFDRYPAHDHTHDGQEEVFVAMRGGGEIEVGEERLPLDADHLVRVGPEAKRKVSPGPDGIRLLVLGGVPGEVYEAPEVSRARRAGPDGELAASAPARVPPALVGPARLEAGAARGPGSAGSGGKRSSVRERSQSEKTEPRVLGTRRWWRQRSQRPAGGPGRLRRRSRERRLGGQRSASASTLRRRSAAPTPSMRRVTRTWPRVPITSVAVDGALQAGELGPGLGPEPGPPRLPVWSRWKTSA